MKEAIPQTAQDKWIPISELDFTCECLKSFTVDTRDFKAKPSNRIPSHEIYKQIPTLRKYKKAFFFTVDELKDMLLRLFEASGGNITWRLLTFNGDWSFKYLHAYLTPDGWILGNRQDRFFKKSVYEELIQFSENGKQ